MRNQLKPFIILLLLFSSFTFVLSYWSNNEKVLLSDVQVLTLYRGKMTTGSRSSPVPQLKCVGGSARSEETKVQTVQCYNRGSDGTDVQWECKAELPSSIRFGNINVGCEGFSSTYDPYILKGSCGLEYTLEYEDGHKGHDSYHHGGDYYDERRSSGGIGGLISLFVFGFIVWAVYKSCTQQPIGGGNFAADGGYGGPFYGGGGPGFGGGNGNGYNYGGGNCAPSAPPMQGGWRPGFWTGLATGGLMGRMFGNRNYGGNYYRPAFGGGFGGVRTYGGGGSFGGGSFGGGTRSSSGFGGTSRR